MLLLFCLTDTILDHPVITYSYTHNLVNLQRKFFMHLRVIDRSLWKRHELPLQAEGLLAIDRGFERGRFL